MARPRVSAVAPALGACLVPEQAANMRATTISTGTGARRHEDCIW